MTTIPADPDVPGALEEWTREPWPDDIDRNLSEREQRGSLLAGALIVGYGLVRRSLPLAAVGGYLAYRGTTGRCGVYQALGVDSAKGISGLLTTFSNSITVSGTREEAFRFFRDIGEGEREGLLRLERSTTNGEVHWHLRTFSAIPLRLPVEKTEERENELLAWSSYQGARLAMRYVIELEDAPGDRGVVVRVRLSYVPPGGGPGAAAGKALGYALSKGMYDDLRRVKQLLETGEIATTKGQPSGRSARRKVGEPVWAALRYTS
jgi:uncharacterized membrane protein